MGVALSLRPAPITQKAIGCSFCMPTRCSSLAGPKRRKSFIERVESGRRPQAAASFSFALDDEGFMPRFVEWLVGLRCSVLALPYGDQGAAHLAQSL